MYEYAARVVAIHDGDTLTAAIDCGFDIVFTQPIRFYGINAPELTTQAGKDALAYLLTLINVGDVVTLDTVKDRKEKYGRYLATIKRADGLNVNDAMVTSGHAVVYLP